MSRDKNFSRFYQIIFLNSLQAPKTEQALLQSPAFHPTLLSRSFCSSTQHFMYLLRTIQPILKNTMYPRFPRLLHYAYLKMADGHVTLWSICHYAFPWWTNGAWALETVETKSMKGTISHFSTWHDGILEQYIRCGVHQSAITFDQFHSFRILEEKLW